MPRILRIINRFNLGGISYNVSYLSRYLPQDYETLLIGGPQEEGEESSLYIPRSMGLNPLLIEEMGRSINPVNDLRAYRRIKRIIREFRPDIVHTHASKAGAIGRLAAFHCKVPVVVHTFHGHVFHGYFGRLMTGAIKTFERYLARRSTAIIAISPRQKNELTALHHICEPAKVKVIPLGFNLERFERITTQQRDAFRSLYKIDGIALGIIGRLAPVKDHFLFIDAVCAVAARSRRKIQAVIVGDGETRTELENYIRQKGEQFSRGDTPALFIFTSWIKDVEQALAGLDIVCLTSRNEGTPVSLIEAQAAGKFVVSTNVGGVGDIIEEGNGLLSEPGDREGFIKNLLSAVENYEINPGQSVDGSKIIEKYSYKRLCNDMDGLYRELLSR